MIEHLQFSLFLLFTGLHTLEVRHVDDLLHILIVTENDFFAFASEITDINVSIIILPIPHLKAIHLYGIFYILSELSSSQFHCPVIDIVEEIDLLYFRRITDHLEDSIEVGHLVKHETLAIVHVVFE